MTSALTEDDAGGLFFLSIVNLLLVSMTVAVVVTVILSGKDLSKHALNIVEGVLLNPLGLLLSVHASLEIAVIAIDHVNRHKPRLDKTAGTRRNIAAAFQLIV